MKDNYGDKIRVHPETDFGNPVVYLAVTSDHDDSPTDAALSPKKARKLAQKLEMAAAVADGTAARDQGYWLALTQDEAETLAVILAKVGGPSGYLGGPSSARVHADSLSGKLENLGFDWEELAESGRFEVDDSARHLASNSIYFKARP